MLLAVLLLSPLGIVALFTFALFADKKFRDSFTGQSEGLTGFRAVNAQRAGSSVRHMPEKF
ncbi:hypothetical protein [Caballeronia insecticola]|uniref:Uncharacterized protein n=1 Tax=Caballeronia insecticola TaxID=758793 RepID=R4WL20_9BURK|nr:hypothetical protein [Caballeronia insecticola]BAN25228.1 hypothetical protein BRPE64_BCDS05670 [Caballeronia insecticola]